MAADPFCDYLPAIKRDALLKSTTTSKKIDPKRISPSLTVSDAPKPLWRPSEFPEPQRILVKRYHDDFCKDLSGNDYDPFYFSSRELIVLPDFGYLSR